MNIPLRPSGHCVHRNAESWLIIDACVIKDIIMQGKSNKPRTNLFSEEKELSELPGGAQQVARGSNLQYNTTQGKGKLNSCASMLGN